MFITLEYWCNAELFLYIYFNTPVQINSLQMLIVASQVFVPNTKPLSCERIHRYNDLGSISCILSGVWIICYCDMMLLCFWFGLLSYVCQFFSIWFRHQAHGCELHLLLLWFCFVVWFSSEKRRWWFGCCCCDWKRSLLVAAVVAEAEERGVTVLLVLLLCSSMCCFRCGLLLLLR
jgi:hypothetical protein